MAAVTPIGPKVPIPAIIPVIVVIPTRMIIPMIPEIRSISAVPHPHPGRLVWIELHIPAWLDEIPAIGHFRTDPIGPGEQVTHP
jgi:hypothetical protein